MASNSRLDVLYLVSTAKKQVLGSARYCQSFVPNFAVVVLPRSMDRISYHGTLSPRTVRDLLESTNFALTDYDFILRADTSADGLVQYLRKRAVMKCSLLPATDITVRQQKGYLVHWKTMSCHNGRIKKYHFCLLDGRFTLEVDNLLLTSPQPV